MVSGVERVGVVRFLGMGGRLVLPFDVWWVAGDDGGEGGN